MSGPGPPARWGPLAGALALGWTAAGPVWLAGLGLAVLSGALVPTAAWFSEQLVDTLTAPHPAAVRAIVLAVLTVGTGAAAAVLGTLTVLIAGAAQRSISLLAAERLYSAVNRLVGVANFEKPAYQDTLQLAEQAAQSTPAMLCSSLLAVLQGGSALAGFAAVLLTVWPPLPFLLLAAAVPTVLCQRVIARRQASANEAAMPYHRRRLGYQMLLTDQQGAKETRVFGLGGFLLGRLLDAHRTATGLELRATRRAVGVQAGAACLVGAAVAASAGYVAFQAAERQITVGGFVLFTIALTAVEATVSGLLAQFSLLGTAIRLFGHYLEVLELRDDVEAGARAVPPLSQGIEFDDVWFRYGGSGDWALSGLTVTLPAGMSVGVVGLNGAGKSTMIKLLCRFYQPDRGVIRWDGVDLREFDPAALRSRLAVTFQDFASYDLTAAESIGVGFLPGLDDRQRIEQAAALAEIHQTVTALPRGYGTMLSRIFADPATGEQGAVLSGGQNQRLALARSLMRFDADLLIWDEPSAGLDAEAEYRIHRALRARRAGRTSLMVSHRLSALREADQIIVLAGGRLAESGRHGDLMAAGGAYARLFELQAEGYLEPPTPESRKAADALR